LPERIRSIPMVAQKFTDKQKPAILFVHNTPMWYTQPFLVRLSKICRVKFLFTHMQLSQDRYGKEMPSTLEGLDSVNYRVLNRYLAKIYPPGIPFGLIRDLFREHCDLIVATSDSIEMLFCFLAARLRRKLIVLKSEAWGWSGKSRRDFGSLFTRFIVPRSDAMLVPGSKHREYFISLGISPNKVFIVPNASNMTGRDGDSDEKEQLKRELKIGQRKVILYVGRLVKQKGVEYLMEAFHELRKERDDVTLLIVGEGECRKHLELLSRDLNLADSVYFTGFIKNTNLPAYYLLCDVCVMPSINYGQADAWGFVLNEAMHFGKPVIATDAVGAAYDMTKDGANGFMVPEKNAHALYQAIKKIISDPELEKRMGEESKRIIEQGFTYDHMVEGFMKAIESIACESRSM